MALKKKRVRSPEQMERHKETNRLWRQRMVEQGLCTVCGKEKAVEGHRMCQSCLERRRRQTHEYTKRARTIGKCVRCRTNWALPHMRICLPCKMRSQEWQEQHAAEYTYEARKDYLKQKRERYKAEGKCIMCGRRTDGEHTRCDMCRERQRISDKKRRERCKVEGRCIICGKPTDGVHTRCPECLEHHREVSIRYKHRKKEQMKNAV